MTCTAHDDIIIECTTAEWIERSDNEYVCIEFYICRQGTYCCCCCCCAWKIRMIESLAANINWRFTDFFLIFRVALQLLWVMAFPLLRDLSIIRQESLSRWGLSCDQHREPIPQFALPHWLGLTALKMTLRYHTQGFLCFLHSSGPRYSSFFMPALELSTIQAACGR